MATEYEQQLVSQYGAGMQDLINAERAKGKAGLIRGVNVDPQDVGRLTSAFQNLNPQGVFTTSNIVGASTNPTPRPDDLLGIRSQIGESLGLPGLQKTYQDIYGQLQAFDQGTTGQQIALEAQPVSLNVMRGQQAESGRQRAFTREGLARQAQVAQAALAAAQQEQEAQFGVRQNEVNLKRQLILENPGAGITFGDTIESAAGKIQNYRMAQQRAEEQKAKKAEEGAYKRQLQQMAMELGISTKSKKGGTLDISGLEKAISKSVGDEKKYKRMLEQAKAAKSGTKEVAFKPTSTNIRQAITEGINLGRNWEEIATVLEQSGVDTTSGSYADQFLRNKFLGENPEEWSKRY